MTKTELKGLKVDDRRAELLRIFEDPDGEFPNMTGDQLNDFIDLNWDEIEAFYQEEDGGVPEEAAAGEEATGDPEAEEASSSAQPEPTPEELAALQAPNPATDLYSGSIR